MDCITEGETKNIFYILVSSSQQEVVNKIISKVSKQITFFSTNKKAKELFDIEYSTAPYMNQENITELLSSLKAYND